jgi:hypothetical protein
MTGKFPDKIIHNLLEIARYDQGLACALLKHPENIARVFKVNQADTAAVRPKRVSALDRIERAWQPYWDRWLQKFKPGRPTNRPLGMR